MSPIEQRNLAFRQAASEGKTDRMISLLQTGVHVDGQGSQSKQTALHRASQEGHLGAIHLLFNLGANLAVLDAKGEEVLVLLR